MHKKRILLVASTADDLTDFQTDLGSDWIVTLSANAAAALAELESQPHEVVVVDITQAEPEGLALLDRLQLAQPKIIRFVLALDCDRERLMKKTLGTHQLLGRPLAPGSLKQAFERALALETWIPRNSIRELVARVRTLPTIPSLYLEVQSLLRSPDATTEEIGAIIAKDMAMMTKLLQVLNSASYALKRKITNPTEAVGILGFETVSSMVMAIKVLGDFDKVKPVYFSIDRLWRHSTEVARNAKELTLMQTQDRGLAEMAFTAGLMHDLGKVVLAANFDEQYRGAQSLARKQQIPVWEVEKEIFGATHGEMGAYLLGLWGMPLEILEVAALHHQPNTSSGNGFSALTAVHVANVFEHELNPDKDGLPPNQLDEKYLTQLGVAQKLPAWKHAVMTRNFTQVETRRKTGTEFITRKPLPKKEKPAVTKKETAPTRLPIKWLYPAMGAAATLAILVWLGCELFLTQNKSGLEARAVSAVESAVTSLSPAQEVRARTPAASPNSGETSPVAKSQVAKETRPSTQSNLVAHATAPVSVKGPFDDLKLQGIFFSSANPQAIINGRTVQAGDRIGEVTIVKVKNSSVTLAWQKELKTIALR